MTGEGLSPYGRSAEAALRHAGLYDAVKPKMVFANNIAQAMLARHGFAKP